METDTGTVLVETDSTRWANKLNTKQRKGWDVFYADSLDIEDGVTAYSIAGTNEECAGVYGSVAGKYYEFNADGNPEVKLTVSWLLIPPDAKEEDARVFATALEAMIEAEKLYPELFL